MYDLSVGDEVLVTGTDEYPKFFHVPGHKGGFVAKGMVGKVERIYVPGECDHLDRSDERDIIVSFDEPKKWKGHFASSEIEPWSKSASTPEASAQAEFVLSDEIELCAVGELGSSCDMVRDFMKPLEQALVLSPDMPLLEAAKQLNSNSITGAPVAVDGQLVGVLTQFDFLYQEQLREDLRGAGTKVKLDSGSWSSVVKKSLASTVRAAMSKPIAIEGRSDMTQVAQLMLRKRFNHMPVVNEEGQLIGILTSQDVLRHVILRMSPDAQ